MLDVMVCVLFIVKLVSLKNLIRRLAKVVHENIIQCRPRLNLF